MPAAASNLGQLLDRVRQRAIDAGVFEWIKLQGESLVCEAKNCPEPAHYRIDRDESGKVWVSLTMADRWLSESIESDLMHTGDKIEELVEDELVEHGYDGGPLPVEHFRSESRLFTFRSPIPLKPDFSSEAAETVTACLLAYEACFRNLGDMSAAGSAE